LGKADGAVLHVSIYSFFTTVGGSGGLVYVILNILLIFLEIVRLLCVLVSEITA